MDWFKKNPFLGGLAVATTLLVAASAYYLSGALGRYSEAETAYASSKAALEQLQAAKPFPSDDNVRKAKDELEGVRKVLAEIGQKVRVEAPSATQTSFMDDLARMVKEIKSRAEAAGVALGDDFYLGFDAYQSQPPSEAAAPKLALQLQSIQKVVSILVDERVQSIGHIHRDPLAVESSPQSGGDKPGKADAPKALPNFVLAPFNVNFTSDQAAAHRAFNRIIDLQPVVFVRLLSVANSAPAAPSKVAGPEVPQPGTDGEGTANKPVFGREVVTVNLGLASITTGSPQAPEKAKK